VKTGGGKEGIRRMTDEREGKGTYVTRRNIRKNVDGNEEVCASRKRRIVMFLVLFQRYFPGENVDRKSTMCARR